MSRIPLRRYIQEIEILIENGNLEDALKHCLYILQTYPKNIATYRLLGKILMEKENYEDSIFIFNKVLEVIPDDFIAHIGLSFISEVHEQLDSAVQHMEYAFEQQPTNPVLREELKRLHLKQEGIEPQNIRLTRGALINMYLRSSLFPQAIAELRIGLHTNPNRVDFKEYLAEALLKQGEKIEAVQTSIEILGKSPFNFTANRIAYEILPKTSDALDTQAFHQHLIDVDPYYAYVGDRINNVENVPDVAVSIEKYNGKNPVIDPETLNLQEEITGHWNTNTGWNESQDLGSEINWDSVIDTKLNERKEKTREIPLDSFPDESVYQEETDTDTSAQDHVPDEIPGWIFDDDEKLKDETPVDSDLPEFSENIAPDLEIDQSESGMVDQDAPTISEPESEVISKHWVKMENEPASGPKSSLEDTQKIAVKEKVDNEKIYKAALKAFDKNDLHLVIDKFNQLIENSSHIEEIIGTIEKSADIFANQPDAWYLLGKAYLKNNQKEQALNAFRKAEETSFL